MPSNIPLNKINDYLWEIPKDFRADMRVPARLYASPAMLASIRGDHSLWQLANVATLPGIQKYALAMPDIHEGYGFPIGGVAAFDLKDGVISPGGIGYDINCGVRLLASTETHAAVAAKLPTLGRKLYEKIPAGAGKSGSLALDDNSLNSILAGGAPRLVEMGYGEAEDLKHLESGGRLADARPDLVSSLAKRRGHDQLGTMGAGNHFVEVGMVAEIFDDQAAEQLGLFKNQITVLIHSGSRGLGHQIATDYIRLMVQAMPRYGINLPDRQLASVPISSPEGQDYFQAMAAGANFAWANRSFLAHEVRQVWQEIFGGAGGRLATVYDVAHNIAKLETHQVNGQAKPLLVHRKGATRAFPGEPVLIPGSMGTASYVLIGAAGSLTESFGSTCHGAGRTMSRHEAKQTVPLKKLKQELSDQGIIVAAGSASGLLEEAPEAYKNVDEVVAVVEQAGLATRVAKLKPLVVVKG